MSTSPWLQLFGIAKSFAGRPALDGVDLGIAAGEVVGLLGENGAGKSTLMNVLYGLVEPDAGRIEIDARPVSIRSPRQARRAGIGMVHQHFSLAPGLSVLESFALDEPGLRFDRARALRELRAGAAELGFAIDPSARVRDLSIGDQQRLEILKALKGQVRLLILDEPTATLTPREGADLLHVIRRLRDAGRSVLFISHKLAEVRAIAERVVVLRAGSVAGERRVAATGSAELVELMLGARLRDLPRGPSPAPGAIALEVSGLSVPAPGSDRLAVQDASFVVRAGEVVGITGVDGNGQSDLILALLGLRPIAAGLLRWFGEPLPGPRPGWVRRRDVAFLPSDRAGHGLFPGLSLEANLLLLHRRRRDLGGAVLFDRERTREFVGERLAAFGVRPAAPELPAGRLSGGNQQRLVLARELAFRPRAVLAENPTRGLDAAASRFVLEELARARAGGSAVLLVTTDLDDALALADRLHVIVGGRVREELSRDPRTLTLRMGGA